MKETTEDERNEARHVSSPERPYDEPSGYGACSKCNCPGFDGNDGTCANGGCGHAYGDHW